MKDEYTRLDIPAGTHIEPCPCCSSDGVLFQYIDDAGDATKVVMCSHGDAIGPQSGVTMEGCPLYFPRREGYRATIRECIPGGDICDPQQIADAIRAGDAKEPSDA